MIFFAIKGKIMMEINLLNNHLKKASAVIVNKIQNKFIKKSNQG